jgi:hypothetical protein
MTSPSSARIFLGEATGIQTETTDYGSYASLLIRGMDQVRPKTQRAYEADGYVFDRRASVQHQQTCVRSFLPDK